MPPAPPLQSKRRTLGEPAKRELCSYLHAHEFKSFSAVVTSQDLSIDTKFGRSVGRSVDTVPEDFVCVKRLEEMRDENVEGDQEGHLTTFCVCKAAAGEGEERAGGDHEDPGEQEKLAQGLQTAGRNLLLNIS